MSPDTHVAPSDVRAGVFLRSERLALYAKVLGCTTDVALGRLIGMTDKTISRARNGIIGEQFIAAVLAAFSQPQHQAELAKYELPVSFEAFFEIREKPTAVA